LQTLNQGQAVRDHNDLNALKLERMPSTFHEHMPSQANPSKKWNACHQHSMNPGSHPIGNLQLRHQGPTSEDEMFSFKIGNPIINQHLNLPSITNTPTNTFSNKLQTKTDASPCERR
jgi:hypothetical protein